MTDVMMIQQSGAAGKYNGAGQQASNVYGHQVVTSSSSASSSCEETESVCSENDKLNSHKEDSDLDDYDKLRGGGQQMDDDCDEDCASVSSKTHSTCSSSKPANSMGGDMNMTGGNRRKQNKPIRIQEDQEKELLKQKAALAASQGGTQTESNPSSQQNQLPEQVVSATKHEPNTNGLKQDPRITAKIADLIINNKLDQIASAKIPYTITNANNNSHLDSLPKSPKVNPMETFCTICKKEVCNKYFLKTHLLNKHNVQIEDYMAMQQNMPNKPNASSTGSLSSASSSSSSSSTSSIYENALEQQMHLTQKLLSQAKKQTGDSDLKVSPSKQLAALASMLQATKPQTGDNEENSSDNFSAYPEANPDTEALLSTILSMNKGTKPGKAANNNQQTELFNHYFNIAMRQQQGMDMMSTLDTSIGLNMSNNQATNGTLNGSMNTSSTSQDFCDICQKQFCNKYYLKKHRMDVHGVTADNKSTPQAVKSKTPSIQDPSKDLTQILMNQLNPLMQMANAQLAAAQSSPSPSMSSASSSSLASSASANKDKKIDTSITSSATTTMTTHPIKNEPDQSNNNISVLNKIESTSEVNCPQCAKVFYNTEFLALHMQNKHGVVKTQTNPVVANNTNSDKENASLLDANTQKISQLLTNSPSMLNNVNTNGNKPAIESPLLQNQPFCEYCNKSFCNKYFLKTHMQKAHGKTLIIENNKTMDEEQLDPNSEAHFASKVIDRVVCDICNKQVCNKYFLRTHKMRVHGLNPRNRSYFSANNNSQNVGGAGDNKGAGMSDSAQMMANNGQFYQDQDVPNNEYNDGEDCEYDEEEMEASEEGEEGEFIGHKSRGMNESGEVGADGTELGEMVNNRGNAGAVVKDSVRARRGSTCSNLSIMTTSSTHNANEGLNMVNNAIKVAKELANYGGYNNGASPISSTSSFSLNSPSSNDLSKKKIPGQTEAFCNLCKRQFCSKYFLRQHMEKCHGLDMTSDQADQTQCSESEEQSVDMSDMTLDNMNNTHNNSSSLPLQHDMPESSGGAMSRVNCLICKKEVCNKYFLRQHVSQRHKISFEEYTEKYGQTFGRKRPATNTNQTAIVANSVGQQNANVNYYNQHQDKLNKLLLKNIKRGKSGMNSEPKRKRKYSGSSSGNESYDTLSSSSNFQQSMEHQQNKKSRAQNYEEEENMFSQQLMSLTSAAEAQGFTELQAFVIENEDSEFSQFFRPSMIYLPVKNRLTDSLCLKVRLRPATANNKRSEHDQEATEEDVIDSQMDNTLDNNHVNSLNNLEEDEDIIETSHQHQQEEEEIIQEEECVEDEDQNLLDNSELRIAQSLDCNE